jgi:hypothetical protein
LRGNQAICSLNVINTGAILVRSADGNGLFVNAECGALSQFALANSGTISGGNCGGEGVSVRGGSAIQDASLVNSGVINGGAVGGSGVVFDSPNTISGLSVSNTGRIAGGFCQGHGLAINANTLLTNVNVLNHGTIVGGPAGLSCCSIGPCAISGFGDGIHITAGNGVALAITNFGTISDGVDSAIGSGGNGVNSTSGSLTINNWGIIAGGGANPISIQLNTSSCNTVNLNGHSSTRGMVMADGNNNYLNLNFTGLSPAEIARIRADLDAQNALNGLPSSGTITVRGELVQWDPLVVTFNPQSYQLQGITPNQAAVGTGLDSLAANPTPGSCTANLLNAIDLSGNVPQALSALSPQRYQIYGDIAKASANLRVTEVNRRLNDLRSGSASDTTTATAAVVRKSEKRGGLFTSGYGTFVNLDGDADLSDARFTSSGVIAGVDHRYSDTRSARAWAAAPTTWHR